MFHGGDIYRNKVKIDFSVNINPLGMPAAVRKALLEAVENCEQYPDIKAERLTESLAERMGVNKEHILLGNGASELFTAIIHAVDPGRIVIPVPSFYGYERAVMSSRGEVLFYEMKEEMGYTLDKGIMEYLTEETDLLFLANPNNPVGNLIDSALLEQIAEECKRKQILIVLDECFLEFSGKEERYTYKNRLETYPHVIVVSAFTKIYAIPGARLGYLFCGDKELRNRIEKHLPEWNLSVFAQAAGIAACQEKEYIEESIQVVETERQYLKGQLEQLGIKVYPSDADYLLIRTDLQLYDELLKKEILIRDCSNFRGLGRGYYRIAVKKHSDNVMLIKGVKEMLQGDIMFGRLKEIHSFQYVERSMDIKMHNIEFVLPEEIEKRSFEIISRELKERNILLPPEQEMVTKRVIHTSADFEYADTLVFSEGAVEKGKQLIKEGADIVTDTNMAMAGINKTVLARFGGSAHCFMAEKEIAVLAKERQITRAAVSMEWASKIEKPVIFVVGNAPTALVQLYEMIESRMFRPAFIIGVPVGFVNVEAAKELILKTDVPYIVNRGRKGGSNVAAAICNAILYELGR
ncbi:hypothetical protein GCM10023142_33350 [Anaerocolumna aminovalerica]|uniref:Histidinol-phosphate aminotransferase n=2 Tax=Anaerocolumna aminovalerica TaxID=1527 RepID=A0A1I5E9M4_9FIRM|nr:precorrin-8X methylmutase [Anaerocolumna aminovalerica]SFO07781.1 histidinol-phosphate aminotransferase [Anaerocolumna aminovalerica]